MVNHRATLDTVFGALAHSTRRSILERLCLGETTVTELSKPFSSSLPALTKHLNVLESAGLIVRTTSGRQRICRIKPEAVDSVAVWIAKHQSFWNNQLDNLDEFLKTQSENNE